MMNYKQNRDLSWLKFNERVLLEAADPSVPLFERLKFLSIFCTNLDEFFMVRVGSIYDTSKLKNVLIDSKTDMTPKEQLEKIYTKVFELSIKKDKIFLEIENSFKNEDIEHIQIKDIEKEKKKFFENYFRIKVFPFLNPQLIDLSNNFFKLTNKSINVVIKMKDKEKTLFGIIPLPTNLNRVIFYQNSNAYVLVEELIYEFVDEIFSGYEIVAKEVIAITRNADVHYDDEDFEAEGDYKEAMRKLIKKRNTMAPVRLEIYLRKKINKDIMKFLLKELNLKQREVFYSYAPLDLSYIFLLKERIIKEKMDIFCYKEYVAKKQIENIKNFGMTKIAKKRDLLFHYPYESMDNFLTLIKESSTNKEVKSIKITIYRLANDAKLVDYLCEASENGKEVLVLMELRARFDEQNNIDFSAKLEKFGCKVIYGIEHFKVHSKICLITYEKDSKESYLTQIGTGNYNEKTAKLYTDLSLITKNQEIGLDAKSFFNNMQAGKLYEEYKHLLVAPHTLKEKLIKLIDEEIDKANNNQPARIMVKINSLNENYMIEKLRQASKSGVEVIMIIRGICCMLPGVKGETENIRITSIVSKYLEHHRIYIFGADDKKAKVYIASADFMTRNLDRRVEIAAPVYDEILKLRIIEIFNLLLSDDVKARILNSNGEYKKLAKRKKAKINSQLIFEQMENSKMEKDNNLFYKVKNYLKNIFS